MRLLAVLFHYQNLFHCKLSGWFLCIKNYFVVLVRIEKEVEFSMCIYAAIFNGKPTKVFVFLKH